MVQWTVNKTALLTQEDMEEDMPEKRNGNRLMKKIGALWKKVQKETIGWQFCRLTEKLQNGTIFVSQRGHIVVHCMIFHVLAHAHHNIC